MIWTVMPLNLVMQGSDNYEPTYCEMTRKNAILLVEEMGRNTAKVVRVISSNPNDYLDPEIQPGSIIELNNQKYKQPAVL